MTDDAKIQLKPKRTAPWGRAFSWATGGLLVMTGLANLLTPNAPFGAVTLVSGLLLLPPLVDKIRERVPPYRHPAVAPMVAIGFLVLLGGKLAPPAIVDPGPKTSTAPVKVAEAPETPPKLQPQIPDISAEVNRSWVALQEATKPCDSASQTVMSHVERMGKGGSMLAAYEASTAASEICADAWRSVGSVSRPKSLSKDQRKAFDVALDECSTAYMMRSAAFREMAKAFDGDMRPSRMATVKGLLGSSTTGAAACGLRYLEAAEHAGVKL